jgi:hypothetical protein
MRTPALFLPLFFLALPAQADPGPIPPLTSWNWNLEGGVPSGAQMIDYDPHLGDKRRPGKVQRNGAEYVICYFSAGSWENGRPDMGGLKRGVDYGNALQGGNSGGRWDSDGQPERWVNIMSPAVRSVMVGRLVDAKQKGCDGVEPDNVDGDLSSDNATGFHNGAHTVEYLRFLSTEAHRLGLKIGLKNSGDIASKVVGLFDFAIVEECAQYGECGKYKAFPANGKAVFQAEYRGGQRECAQAKASRFSLTLFPADRNVKNGRPCR